ncbi:MAG: chain length determinant protein EpsF [Pseudorhodoferax sp.]
MTFGKLIAMVRARWWLVVAATVLTTVSALIVSLMMSEKFQASAFLMIDVKPDPISAVTYPGLSSPSFINTQIDVLRSSRVALRVVNDLKLVDRPNVRDRWLEATEGKGTVEQWLADGLRANMTVTPSKESNVLQVSFRAGDPQYAAAVTNAFAQAYMATALELRVDPARRYAGYFDEQVKAARQELEAAQSRLSAFQRANGLIGTDERFDVENTRLNELSSQLVAVQAVLVESGSRQAQADGAASDRTQEVLNNSLITQLRAELGRSEARLRELSIRFGDSHPQVIEAKAAAAELRTRLDTEMRRVSGGAAVTNAINRQREAQIRASLEEQRAKVLRMKAVRDDAAVLLREVDGKQRAFDNISMRLTQSNLESQSTLNNVSVLGEATEPLNPVSPNIQINTALALVVGMLLGTGLALLLELRDRRVRDFDDVVAAMQIPVLGVLPAPDSRRSGRKHRLLAVEQRLLGGLAVSRSKKAM